jgi:hypothetical protein
MMNCSVYGASFSESNLLTRARQGGASPLPFPRALLYWDFRAVGASFNRCGLLELSPLSCQRLITLPHCRHLDAGPVLDCSVDAGP